MDQKTDTKILQVEYNKIKLMVRKEELFLVYATFVANEYHKLKIKPGDYVIDFGAGIGDFTVKASKLLRDKGEVFAVEPSRENVKLLKANLELNNVKNVKVFECAISDRDGFAYLNEAGSAGGYIMDSVTENGERVKTCTIETFLKDAGLVNKTGSVVKMDIEGAEIHVLKNIQFLRNVRELAAELHGSDNVNTIPDFLRMHGFEVSTYRTADAIKETVKSIIRNPPDFVKLEVLSDFTALRGFLSTLRSKNPIPSLAKPEFKIIYAKRSSSF